MRSIIEFLIIIRKLVLMKMGIGNLFGLGYSSISMYEIKDVWRR